MSTTARIGPTLTLAASCLDCDHLRLDCDVYRCVHPKASSVAEPMICSLHREPRAPAWCPELPGARLAMAREIVAEAERAVPQRRHMAIISDHASIGQIGCMRNPSKEDIEHAMRENQGCRVEEIDADTCLVCAELGR